MNANATPEGFMKNSQGHLVPRDLVSEIDVLRDTVVRDIVKQAQSLQEEMVHFKTSISNDMAAFIELSAEKYDTKIGGDKGNCTLSTFDGKYRVVRSNQESISFDERLNIAKELVDQCIHKWMGSLTSAGLGMEVSYIRALVEQAFHVDKKGKINRNNLINLTKLKIDDPQWQSAMQAILDSQQVSGTKFYFRVFERIGGSEKWHQIVLDMAAL